MPIVLKSVSLSLLEPPGPAQACIGIALPYITAEYGWDYTDRGKQNCSVRTCPIPTSSVINSTVLRWDRTRSSTVTCQRLPIYVRKKGFKICPRRSCNFVSRVRKMAKSDYYLRHVCCPSVSPSAWNNSPPAGRIFIKCDISAFSEKSVEKVKVLLKSDKNKG